MMKRYIDASTKGLLKNLLTSTLKMGKFFKSILRDYPAAATGIKLCLGLYAAVQAVLAAKDIAPVLASKIKAIKEYTDRIKETYGEKFDVVQNTINAQRRIIKALIASAAAVGLHVATGGTSTAVAAAAAVSPAIAKQAEAVVGAAALKLSQANLASARGKYQKAMKLLRSSILNAKHGSRIALGIAAKKAIAIAERRLAAAEMANKTAEASTNKLKKESNPQKISTIVAEAKDAQAGAVQKTKEAVDAVANATNVVTKVTAAAAKRSKVAATEKKTKEVAEKKPKVKESKAIKKEREEVRRAEERQKKREQENFQRERNNQQEGQESVDAQKKAEEAAAAAERLISAKIDSTYNGIQRNAQKAAKALSSDISSAANLLLSRNELAQFKNAVMVISQLQDASRIARVFGKKENALEQSKRRSVSEKFAEKAKSIDECIKNLMNLRSNLKTKNGLSEQQKQMASILTKSIEEMVKSMSAISATCSTFSRDILNA